MYRQFGAVALAASMFVSSTAFAAGSANQGALPAGKVASVKQAQWWRAPHWVWIAGVGFVAIGIGLVVSGNGHGTVGSTNTCPFSGCPVPPSPPPTTTTATATTTTH